MVPYERLDIVCYSLSMKYGFAVVQGHLKWCGLIDHMRLSIGPPL